MNDEKIKALAVAVLENEAAAISVLINRINDAFVGACKLILQCQGRIIVMGMGKSGHIGGKIAATLASTGTPAFFVHPGEASHGDLGMITKQDVVLAFSNSGETQELTSLLPVIKRLNVPLISVTGNNHSTLAKNASVHIDVSIEKEACPLGLAPTTSTTVALAMGDALAIAVLEQRGFTADDFAFSHPAGSLGKRLLLRVHDIMHSGDDVPAVRYDASLSTALAEMTSKGLGMAVVVDEDYGTLGVFTDGDLRRVLDHGSVDIKQMSVRDVMTRNCKTVTSDKLAAETLQMMQKYKINALPVVDKQNRLVGAMNMHDLLRAGVL